MICFIAGFIFGILAGVLLILVIIAIHEENDYSDRDY